MSRCLYLTALRYGRGLAKGSMICSNRAAVTQGHQNKVSTGEGSTMTF